MSVLVSVTLSLFCGDVKLELPDGVRLERWFVPVERQAQFLPAGEIFHLRTLGEFEKLVARRCDIANQRPRPPVKAHIQAKLDPQLGMLNGVAEFWAPAGKEIVLSPWNFVTLSAKFLDRDDKASSPLGWGCLDDGQWLALAERPVDVLHLRLDWNQIARRTATGWRLEFVTPRMAIGTLDVEIPVGWRVRSDLISRAIDEPISGKKKEPENTKRLRLEFGGTENNFLEFVADSPKSIAVTPLVQSRRVFLLDPLQTQLQAEFQFEANREPIENIALIFDASIQPRDVQVNVPVDWRFEILSKAPNQPKCVRWIGTLRRPAYGGVRLSFQSDLGMPPAGAFRTPLLYAENIFNRGDTIQFALHSGLGLANLTLGDFEATAVPPREDGRFCIALVGYADRAAASNRLPSLTVNPADPVVDTTQDMTLDFTVRPPRLVTRVQWRCLDGLLFKPRLLRPKGWAVERLELRNQDRPVATHLESTGDGDYIVLDLEKPVEAGQSLQTTLRLEQVAGDFSPLRTGTFALPLVKTAPSRSRSAIAVACYLNDRWRMQANNVQSPRETLLPYLAKLPPTLVPGLSFSTISNADRPTLTFQPMRAEYAVDGLMRLKRHRNGWDVEWTSEIRPGRGSVAELLISSDIPIPAAARWKIDATDSSDATLETTDGGKKDGRFLRTVHFDGDLTKPTRLRAEWRVASSDLKAPLLDFPAATTSTVRCEVHSANGLPLNVAATGLDEESAAGDSNADLVWATQYQRLRPDAKLTVSFSPLQSIRKPSDAKSPKDRDRIAGRATVRSSIAEDRATHEFEVTFNILAPRRLQFDLPTTAIVAATVDDRDLPLRATLAGSETVFPVEVGTRVIKIISTEILETRLGFPRIHATMPFGDWRISDCRWRVFTLGTSWFLLRAGGSATANSDILEESEDSNIQFGSGNRTVRQFLCGNEDSPPTLDLVVVSWTALRPLLWPLAGILFAVAVVASGRISSAILRRILFVIALLWAAAAWGGGLTAAIATFLLLPATFALAAGRIVNGNTIGFVAAIALLVSTPNVGIAQSSDRSLNSPGGQQFRIIVPFDSRNRDREPDRAFVPDALLRYLEDPVKDAAKPQPLLRLANYKGKLVDNTIRWTVVYEGYLASAKATAELRMDFDRVSVRAVKLNGTPALSRAPDEDGVVTIEARKAGEIRVELELESTIEHRDGWLVADLGGPKAAKMDVELDTGINGMEVDVDTTNLGLIPDASRRRIVGTVGPTRRLRMAFREAILNPTPANPPIRSLQWVDVSKTGIEWSGSFSVGPSAFPVRHLSFIAPADLRIRRIEGSNVRWWKIVPTQSEPSNATSTIDVELATPSTAALQLKMQGFSSSKVEPNGAFLFPTLMPLDTLAESTWIGVRAGTDREIRDLPSANVQPVAVATFESEWERTTGAAIERLTSARELRMPTAVAKFQLTRTETSMAVSQTIEVQTDSESKRAETALTATLIPKTGAELFVAHLVLPRGFEIARVDGETVRRWFVAEGRLTCFRDSATAAEWTIRITGRFTAKKSGTSAGDAGSTTTWNLGSFDWVNAGSATASWTIRSLRLRRLDLSEPVNLSSSRLENGQWLVGSTMRGHGFRLTALREPLATTANVDVTNSRHDSTASTPSVAAANSPAKIPPTKSGRSGQSRLESTGRIRLSQSGPNTLRLLAGWRLTTFRATQLEIALPSALHIDSIRLDGQTMGIWQSTVGKWLLQIPQKTGVQELEISTSTSLSNQDEIRIDLPRLAFVGTDMTVDNANSSSPALVVGASLSGEWNIRGANRVAGDIGIENEFEALDKLDSIRDRQIGDSRPLGLVEVQGGESIVIYRGTDWRRYMPRSTALLAIVAALAVWSSSRFPTIGTRRWLLPMAVVGFAALWLVTDMSQVSNLVFGLLLLAASIGSKRVVVEVQSPKRPSAAELDSDATVARAGQ